MTHHLTFVSIPGHGHVNPTLPLVEELARRGNRVTYITGQDCAGKVERAGAEFVLMPGSPFGKPPTASDGPTGADSAANPGAITPEVVEQLQRRTLDMVEEGLPAVERQLDDDPPDLVCYDAMTPAGRMAAEKRGLPAVQLCPSFASNEEFSLMGEFFPDVDLDGPLFDEVRRKYREFSEKHGVSFELTGKDAAVRIEPLNLVFVPQEFQLAGETFDERFAFLGPSLGMRARSDEWQPPEGSSPVVFVSLGTAPFNNRPDFFRSCAEAFAGSAWHVVMAIGDNVDRADLGEMPENFEVRQYFPQPEVLRRADAFVSHAGMNSTMEALYREVPLVTVPQMPEQEANSRRVRDLGLGREVDGSTVTAEQLRRAVDEVSADTGIRARLAEIGRTVREAGGAVLGADALEKHLADAGG